MRPSLGLVACVLFATSVRLGANMAAPIQPGTIVGEPMAALRGLAIEREKLDIDLRALDTEMPSDGDTPPAFGTVLVSTVYNVRNDSAARTITLEFVAEAIDTAHWSVFVDGRRIASTYRTASALPRSYAAPLTTPGIDGGQIEYEGRVPGVIRFDAPLESGRHTIRVEYIARATRHVVDHPLVHWQIGYILAPARQWQSFGGIDMTVTLPPRWGVATNPSLERHNDVLTGHFDGIPADAISITARARHRWWFAYLEWIPSALVTLVGAYAALRSGRRLGRRLVRADRKIAWAIPVSVGAGFVLATATFATGFLGAEIIESQIGAGQQAWGNYDFIFYQLMFTTVAFIAGTVAAQSGAALSLRRARRRYDPRWTDAYGEPDEGDSGRDSRDGSDPTEVVQRVS